MKEKERNLVLNTKIINETVETIIDSIYEKTEYYMLGYGNYTIDNEFFEDREEYMIEVIKELNNRIK
jgi:spore coat polysaccharide biosynthesis predicted glycosyltransferase SpsG